MTRVNRWENENGMFSASTEEEISIQFTDNTVFEVYKYESSSAQGELESAEREDVKLDSNIHLWGQTEDDAFIADRVIIWRMA